MMLLFLQFNCDQDLGLSLIVHGDFLRETTEIRLLNDQFSSEKDLGLGLRV